MHNAGFQRPKKNSRERRTSSFYSLARLRADSITQHCTRCVATEKLEILLDSPSIPHCRVYTYLLHRWCLSYTPCMKSGIDLNDELHSAMFTELVKT